MNILYLCADRGIPIRGHKGAAVHVRKLTDAFVRAGHRTVIMTPRPGPEGGPAPLAEVVPVPMSEQVFGADTRNEPAMIYPDVLARTALEWLSDHPCGLIYERHSLWSDAGARLRQATQLPFVLEVNAPLRLEAARFRVLRDEAHAAQVERKQFSKAQRLCVVSRTLARYVIKYGASPENVHIMPNGVDPMLFHPGLDGSAVRAQYGLTKATVIGFVGTPRPWHDLDTLVQALIRLREADSRFHLLLVGPMSPELPRQLEDLGLQESVTLTGAVPHTAVPAYIAAMDVAVSPHPSLDRFYFSPLKLYEYLACAVPTVTANIGQPGQLIAHGRNGRLYRPGDAADLARQIRGLVNHPHHAGKLAWQGAVTVLTRHTWDRNAAAIIEWISAPQPGVTGDAVPPIAKLPLYDDRLRAYLYQASRPDLMASGLSDWLPQQSGPLEIEVLKYKPRRRCILAYRSNGRGVIGKVFKDGRGRRLLRLQEHLWRQGFGPDAEDRIYVPEPLGYLPHMHMMVQAIAPGQTLNELVTAARITPWMPLCARALAKFHQTPVPTGDGDGSWGIRPYSLVDELANLVHFASEVSQRRLRDAGRVHDLHAALTSWARDLPPRARAGTIHRDFYYSQMLVVDNQLTLIDFDLMACGDPAIDVANFVAHLSFLGADRLGDADALTADAHLFLECYHRVHPIDHAFRQRLAFYEAATFFRLLNVTSSRPGLFHLFDSMFELASARLETA